ncbi:MAG: tetratricopeptide repeat protein [Planctomycetota bacterium]
MELAAIFGAAFLLYLVLAAIPGLDLVARVPVLGLLGCVLFVSGVWQFLLRRLTLERRDRALARQIGAVDTPHMSGKLGALLQDKGRARSAIPNLEAARSGEPDSIEWAWRLARAYADTGRDADALREVRAVLDVDELHAYGAALLLEARLLARTGRHAEAIEACERFERNHGEEPEGLYELGRVHAARGDRPSAKHAFARAADAASRSAAFKRRRSPWIGLAARVRALTG